jgi:hypothetical protein
VVCLRDTRLVIPGSSRTSLVQMVAPNTWSPIDQWISPWTICNEGDRCIPTSWGQNRGLGFLKMNQHWTTRQYVLQYVLKCTWSKYFLILSLCCSELLGLTLAGPLLCSVLMFWSETSMRYVHEALSEVQHSLSTLPGSLEGFRNKFILIYHSLTIMT